MPCFLKNISMDYSRKATGIKFAFKAMESRNKTVMYDCTISKQPQCELYFE